MAKFIVILAAIASVQSNSVNRGWSSPPGWSTPPPTTPGWSAPPTEPPTEAPTTTPGWSPPATEPPTEPPATTPGWSPPETTPGWSPPPPPSNPGWGSPANNVSINLNAGLAAVGSGAASEIHDENIHVSGADGVPAELSSISGGESVVAQDGNIYQVSSVDNESAFSLNVATASQVALADEGLSVAASGADILVGQSGLAGAVGEGATAIAADTTILVNH